MLTVLSEAGSELIIAVSLCLLSGTARSSFYRRCLILRSGYTKAAERADDPRDGLMRDLDLPCGERELVVDRDRIYDVDGADSRTLAAVGAFRVVSEHDLDIHHDTLDHLRDEGLVETVDRGHDERGLTLTREGRDLLELHALDRDGAAPSIRVHRPPGALPGHGKPALDAARVVGVAAFGWLASPTLAQGRQLT